MPLLCSTSTFGHRRFYVLFMRLKLAIQRQRPLMVFAWEQISKCQFQQFIFHSELRCLTHPSRVTPALWVFRIEYLSFLVNITTQTERPQVELYLKKPVMRVSHGGRQSRSAQKGKQFLSCVCAKERSVFGQGQQRNQECHFNSSLYFHSEFKPGELANYPWMFT